MVQKITPFLWFADQAEEAANFYVSLFDDARILETVHLADAPGSGATVVYFEIAGQAFAALNGSPVQFTPAVSFHVACEDQAEVDRLWERLCEGGAEDQCGWLRDRFGVSWQIIPTVLEEWLADPDPAVAKRVMEAMLRMQKIDITALQRARDGVQA